MTRFAALALAAALAPAAAAAQAVECYGPGALAAEPFGEPQLKAVAGDQKRLRFRSDGDGCPEAGERCAVKAFVTAGDLVVAAGARGDHVCATFTGSAPRATSTTGWLPQSALVDPPSAPSTVDWKDEWRSGREKQIAIKAAANGALSISGAATFGAYDPERLARGSVNTGEFEGVVTPEAGRLDLVMDEAGKLVPFGKDAKATEGSCRVRMWRLGPYLVVADNNACGGVNVTFSGAYRRR